LIAESALNDTRLIRPRELGGFGLDAQWNDDFHHSLHTVLTDERSGYYRDFDGLEDLATAWREGYVYSGRYSRYRLRTHGNASRNVPARRFVVFAQNHDQVGNRLAGDRLSATVSFEKVKRAAGLVLLSPFVPLIFMGEEYGETAPFQYFVSHSDPGLIQAVREGRRKEFSAFEWGDEPPDPQDEDTFLRSRLNRSLKAEGRHAVLFGFHRELLGLRAQCPALANPGKKKMTVESDRRRNLLFVRRWGDDFEAALVFHFSETLETLRLDLPEGRWRKRLDSTESRWMGPGSGVPDMLDAGGPIEVETAPHCVLVFTRE
jgi:maltooligosyltrehalose trehalohydrolase